MFYIFKNKEGNQSSYLKKNRTKILFLSIYFVIFILYLIDLWHDFLPGTLDTILSTASMFSATAVIFYNEMNFIFILINKAYIYHKNPTVFWTATCTIYSDKEESFKKRNSAFISKLREKGEIKHFNIDHNDEDLFKLTINNHREMNIFIYKEYVNEDEYKITFKYSSSMSYVDSKNEYEYFLNLVKSYSYSLSKQEKIEVYTDQSLQPNYTLSIEFKEYNPYYSVLMKNINSNKIKSFRLNFSVDGAEINIIDNKLTVSSKEEETIKKISNDYIAISSK